MEKEKKGVRLDHISKIYKDPKTGKDFYAVKDKNCCKGNPFSKIYHIQTRQLLTYTIESPVPL